MMRSQSPRSGAAQARRNTEAAAAAARRAMLAGGQAEQAPARAAGQAETVATSQGITKSLLRTRQLMAQVCWWNAVPTRSPSVNPLMWLPQRLDMMHTSPPVCRNMAVQVRLCKLALSYDTQELEHTSATLAAMDASNERLAEGREELRGHRSLFR